MNYRGAKKYLTHKQASQMGLASQKVQALKRLAAADHDPAPTRSGLQLAIITLDMRTQTPSEHCALLFDIGLKNSYRWMLDFEKQHNKIGWHDAGRTILTLTRPLAPLY
jgi:hypothetical protein